MKKHKIRKMTPWRKREWIIPLLCLVIELIAFRLAVCMEAGDFSDFLGSVSAGIEEVSADFVRALLQSAWTEVHLLTDAYVKNSQEISNILITFAAITVSVVILFYSLIDAKNFGIPHRTIMYYFLGSCTLPLEFFFLLVKLPFICIAVYEGHNEFAGVLTIHSILQQFLVIGLIVLSTSRRFNIAVIRAEECRQYRYRKKLSVAERKYFSVWEASHAMQAMKSDELYSDRIRLLQRLLEAPIWYAKSHHREAFHRNRWNWECADMYDYYYEQATSIFGALKEEPKERDKLYQTIYAFLAEVRDDRGVEKLRRDPKYGVQYRYLLSAVSGAFMNAAIVCKVNERRGFCEYILNEIFQDETERNRQISFYILMHHAYEYAYKEPMDADTDDKDSVIPENSRTNQKVDYTYDRAVTRCPCERIQNFEKWMLHPEDMEFCECCWRLLVQNLTVDLENADTYYNDTVDKLFKYCEGKERLQSYQNQSEN